jgi:Rieske Fe-S protein
MSDSESSRRGFLKAATLAIGGAIGAVMTYPLVRYFFYPMGHKTVDSPEEPLDAIAVDALEVGAPPVRVTLTADEVRDGWAVSDNVPLGSAWVRRREDGEIEALSAACPHLGCAIDFDTDDNEFKCPCHKSAFSLNGDKKAGPAKRGLDPLPHTVVDGRVKLTWIRYRPDVSGREKV